MKLSYNWLEDYCEFDLPAHELSERLSAIGLCVETCEPVGDDHMLDVEVTANRPDCLSHMGIAREIAAMTGGAVKPIALESPRAGSRKLADLVAVSVLDPGLCPHYTARLITGVSIGPSPEWMQRRLITCGLRPVNNVVDITNYVLFAVGQPLHVFDLARLAGNEIIVRRARRGEKITSIDGTECELTEQMCVIADRDAAVALAGVMGGLDSQIGESTTDVVLESARFRAANIRRASRALRLFSDSSYRFERGVDPEGVDFGSRMASALILELAGGELASGCADIRADETETPAVTLRFSRLGLVLGISVPRKVVRQIFKGLGLDVLEEGDNDITVRVPSWRGDLRREVDLIEEVIRIYGYDNVSETTRIPISPAPLPRRIRCERKVRAMLAGAGFCEVVTNSLVPATQLQFAQPWHRGEALALRNPVSVEKTHLRLSGMGNLAQVKKLNQDRGTREVNLFELSKVYLPRDDAPDDLPQEKQCLTLLCDEPDGLFVLKGVAGNLLELLGIKDALVEEPRPAGPFGEGESLALELGGELLGCVGILDAKFADELDLSVRPALMELDFELLVGRAQLDRTTRPVPQYPPSVRDVSVVVDEALGWRDLRACIEKNVPDDLEAVDFVSIYRGDQIPEGKKSVTFSITLRSRERTLTSEEVDGTVEGLLAALARDLGATLR